MNKAVSIYFAGLVACTLTSAHAATPSALVDTATMQASTQEDSTQEDGQLSQQQLQALLVTMKQFRADFEQSVMDADNNVVHEAQGKLTMTRPDKLRWETTFPDETLLVADGEAVWNLDTFVEQVTVLSQANAIKDNPIMLLTANDAATWDKFTIEQVRNPDEPSRRGFQVTPKEKGGQIETLTLQFNQDNELAVMTMLDAQQQTSTLVFNNIETRFPLAADTFTIDIPESYIVDDQR